MTSLAHNPATASNAALLPIFLEEQGTCTATLSRTWRHSSLSFRCDAMKSTGSYSENLRARSTRDKSLKQMLNNYEHTSVPCSIVGETWHEDRTIALKTHKPPLCIRRYQPTHHAKADALSMHARP